MGVKERLIDFLNRKDLSQGKFEAACQLANGFVNNIGKSIRGESLDKISAIYPDLNRSWLMLGEGEMLLQDQNSINAKKITGNYARTVDSSAKFDIIPLLPISAHGGSLDQFFVSVKDIDCERIVSPIKGADFAITVAGESMAPEYPNGSKILIKKINEKAFIEWGKVYVLDTVNGTVVKTVVPGKDGCLRCESINLDPKFFPFEICMADIFGIYRVMMCMAVK